MDEAQSRQGQPLSARFRFSAELSRPTLDVSVEASGDVLGLFGRSGAGKSTLLAALVGLVKGARVEVEVDGERLVDTDAGLAPPVHRRGMGMVFQDHRLFPHRSVRANLTYGMPAARGKGPPFEDVVQILGLTDLLDSMPGACSGGERQRVALGRAILSAPKLLLLDEPLASLDRGLRREILPYLASLRDAYRIPMIYVSHELEELLAITDEILLLEEGRVRGLGSAAELAMQDQCLELLHDCGLVFTLPCEFSRRTADGLVWVQSAGGHGIACGDFEGAEDPPGGAAVDLLLRPEDVILARPGMDAELSLTNRIEGRIRRITKTARRVLVEMECGGPEPLLAEVTERALQRLDLREGSPAMALFKAQATRGRLRTK